MRFCDQRQHSLPKNAFLMAEQIEVARAVGDEVKESILVKRFRKRYGDLNKYKERYHRADTVSLPAISIV